MVLVIDVGNTNITFGVYDGKKLKTTFRLMAYFRRIRRVNHGAFV